MTRLFVGLFFWLVTHSAIAALPPTVVAPPPALSSTAEAVYSGARPRLLQIRTLLDAAGRQSTIGSGFLVSEDGVAITNYHVVSQYALEPNTYRLEYIAPDGSKGGLKLLSFDVANDLAVVRLEKRGMPFFEFEDRALKGNLPKGERLYSMGNPLDLGFTIVEGTYNGFVEKSYNERIHFSGAINSGMSGGPTVTVEGKVVGINVAKQIGSELVSFLVPARFATALLEGARANTTLTPEGTRAEIGRQLTAWQSGLYQALGEKGFRAATFGPYRASESSASWFNCWARTNAHKLPKPRALIDTTNCDNQMWLFVSGDMYTGRVEFSHSHVRSIDLNAFQFSQFVSQQFQPSWLGGTARKRLTQQRCHEDFLSLSATGERPPLRAIWCARAYREFEGLYDVSVVAITQDRDTEALVSNLSMQGVAYPNALALAKRFLGAVEWAK